MPIKAKPGEQYTVRRKVLKIFGAAFHVYDEHGSVVGYCKQKAFKLKEDIRLYTGPDRAETLANLHTLRQQTVKRGDRPNVALSDFVAPEGHLPLRK